jgi:cyclic pyranopterin phosphate synthase
MKDGAGDFRGPKGAVFQTTIVAGIQAAKRTWELVPMCHLIPLDHCDVQIRIASDTELLLECHTQATHRTGVEMEALIGVTMAAVTVFDMCKALSPDIEILEAAVVEKRGGKTDHAKP